MPHFSGIDIKNHNLSIALLESLFNGVRKAFIVEATHFQAVNHEFDIMILVAVNLHAVCEFAEVSIHPHIDISFLNQLLKKLFIVSLAVFNERCQDIDFAVGIFVENKVDNLIGGIFHHLLATLIAICIRHTSIQETKEIINFGSCSYSASRILVHRFLLDRDYRA